MAKEFEVGDRVKVVKKSTSSTCKEAVVGDTGTVIRDDGAWGHILVEFDQERTQYISGEKEGCDRFHGYWCKPDILEHIRDSVVTEKIIITTDGVTTLARHYKGKKMLAASMDTRPHSDTADFLTRAGLVFDRLTKTEKEQPKPEPKFKVDDIVKIIGSGNDITHALYFNSPAVVKKVETNARKGWDYYLEGVTPYGIREQWVAEADLEKYEKE